MSRRLIASIAAVLLLATLALPAAAVDPATQTPTLHGSPAHQRVALRDRSAGRSATPRVPAGTVGVVQSVGYIDGDEAIVIGEVLNNTTSRRLVIEVRATIYSGDQVVGTFTENAFTTRLGYGSVTPFVLFGSAPGADNYVVTVIDPGNPITTPVVGVLELSVGAPVVVGDTRTYSGQIGNHTAVGTLGYVAVTTFDAGGNIVDANWSDPIGLGAQTSTGWSVDFFEDPSIVRAVVTAEASEPGNDDYYLTSLDNFFDDIGVSSFRGDILWLYQNGITKGCSQGKYCPAANVRRDEMASFLVRALGLTGNPPDAFSDDNGNTHELDINRLKAAGITSGCATGLFCPAASVRRDEMASFLSRALELVGPAPDAFTDDNGNTHEANINKVAAAGITTGCAEMKYCPAALVTRAQMAAFLHRAFD